jgi:hypothetical protein
MRAPPLFKKPEDYDAFSSPNVSSDIPAKFWLSS